MDEETIVKEWARKRFPKYASNIEAMKILFKQLAKSETKGIEYVKATISEARRGDFLHIKCRALIVEKSKKFVKTCKVCGKGEKKGCSCGEGFLQKLVISFTLADESDMMVAIMFSDDESVYEKFKVGDEVKVFGRLRRYNDNVELVIESIERFDKREVIEKLKDEVNEGIDRYEFEFKLVDNWLTLDEVKDVFTIEDGKVRVISDEEKE